MKTQSKNALSTTNWVVKSNVLNEVRHSKMNISQSKLFAVYLSKINPKDVHSREVSFKLEEYAKIMGFKGFNISRLKKSAADLLRLVIVFTKDDPEGSFTKDGDLVGFTTTSSLLFNRFKLYKNNDGEWIVNINCHDDVLHLMFELKSHFFKYQLWNALQLTSSNQQRIYELLKQYEYAGAREISVKDFREFLGLKKDEYTDWDNFRRRVLEPAQEALLNHSDIKFTWESSGRRGPGGKIKNLKFNIEKNENYERETTLEEFLSEQEHMELEEEPKEFVSDIISTLSEACNDEFSPEEISLLHSLMVKIVPHSRTRSYELELYDYLTIKYNELNMRAKHTKITHRFGYLKKIIQADSSLPL